MAHYKYDICVITTIWLITGTYLIAVYHNGGIDSFVKSDATG